MSNNIISLQLSLGIESLLANYADSIHRVNSDDWAKCWAKDATWTIGTLDDPQTLIDISGIETIVPAWQQAMTLYTEVQHKILTNQVWVNDDEITGRCYVEEFLNFNGSEYSLFGVYNDIFKQSSAGYVFYKRKFNILQLKKGDEARQFFPHPNK